MLLLFTFALYVSTFFLFNQEEDLRKFVFDYKVHGIIFCSVLSIAAGGIINKFYDNEKDMVSRPFRTKLQSFLKEKYFLYSYIFINFLTILISALLSPRILFFFFVYQFFIWFYSHKLSKILIVNNLTYVSLSLYPFFGMLVYYQYFSYKIFLMAIFLFLLMLTIDLIKDLLTKNVDKVFGYNTIANVFDKKTTYNIITFVIVLNIIVSGVIVYSYHQLNIFSWYFIISIFFFSILLFPVLTHQKNKMFWVINLFRAWVFVGVIFMLLNGIFS